MSSRLGFKLYLQHLHHNSKAPTLNRSNKPVNASCFLLWGMSLLIDSNVHCPINPTAYTNFWETTALAW